MVTVSPEVAADQESLGGLPEAWRTPQLEATLLRRARLRAAARVLAEEAGRAQVAVNAALARLVDGDATAAGEMVGAETARAAAERAASLLPAPDLDPGAVDAVMRLVTTAWAQADVDLHLPVLDVEGEIEAWARACAGPATFEPVEVRDAERELIGSLRPLRGRLAAWRQFAATWAQSAARSNTDPLALLASAATYLRIAGEMAGEVEQARADIDAANTRRREAGLTWTAQTAARVGVPR